jgi:hypothetical protein
MDRMIHVNVLLEEVVSPALSCHRLTFGNRHARHQCTNPVFLQRPKMSPQVDVHVEVLSQTASHGMRRLQILKFAYVW